MENKENEDSQIITGRETGLSDILLDKDSTKNENETIIIDNKKRIIIFIILIIIANFSGCDGGIIPQQNTNIQKEFGGEGEQRIGLFGSIDSIGRIFGSIIFSLIMGKMNRKYLLILTLLFKSFTLFIPLIIYYLNSDVDIDYYLNIIFRCLSGLAQVFYSTYLPVWCDQYGKKSRKALWVTTVEIGFPIGIITGYGLGYLFNVIFDLIKWRISFAFIGIILIICAIIILFFDKIYFSEKFVLIDDFQGKEDKKINFTKKSNIFGNMLKILSNKIFLFSTFCNSIDLFGSGVLQYFVSKYMEVVLGIDEAKRFIIYVGLCLFGSIVGMFTGGIICSKLGGYIKKNSMIFVIILMIIGSIFSILIACHKIFILFLISSWVYLFTMGAIIPPLSGIIISCLENNLRGSGFSVCNFITNLTGNFPSSYVYSLLVDTFKKDDSNEEYRYAMIVSMVYNFVGVLFIIIAGIFRFKIKGDLSKTTNEEKNVDITNNNENNDNIVESNEVNSNNNDNNEKNEEEFKEGNNNN